MTTLPPEITKQLTSEGEHRSQFQTERMQVPATFFMSDDLLPSEETFRQVEDIASHDMLHRTTVAMPDVCSKPGRRNAAGTTIVSLDRIIPELNDSDPNCGMRVVKTSLNDQNTTPEEIDKLFETLVTEVPTKALVGTKVPFDVVVDTCRGGTRAVIDHVGMETRNEIENAQSGGNYFGDKTLSQEELFDVVPQLYLHFAKYRLGITGAAGNHFLDLMRVTDLIDPEIAKMFGLEKGQYLFMIHTGSGILGQYTMYTYTAKKREHVSQSLMVTLGSLLFTTRKKDIYAEISRKIKEHMSQEGAPLLTYDGSTPEAEMYMQARAAASNFGVANRAMITHNISEAIKVILGKDPEMDLLYDLPHISVEREEHFGKDMWVHRNNTSRAFGPSRMAHHPLFGKTGEPVYIPSSMSTEAFIGVGTDHNTDSYYSAPHGTGKGADMSEDSVPTNNTELFAKMNEKGVKLYGVKSKKTVNQDSSRYKDVSRVLEGVEANNIAHIVAKMEPVAVIMY